MTTAFSTSAGLSAPANLWAPTNIPTPADPLAPASLAPSPHAGLPVVQNMIKPFFIGKLVIAANNTTTQRYTKDTI